MLSLRDAFRRAIRRPRRREPDIDEYARTLQNVTTENEEHFRGAPYSVSIPNVRLRAASSTGELGYWYAIGEAWAHIADAFLPASARVLDIGCGCGKMARFFVHRRDLVYTGLDVHYPSIYWCDREFARYSDRFRFAHVDVWSRLYNPLGTLAADRVTLPVDDESIDLVICGSLFTHLPEPGFLHYLAELRRCLAPSGTALVSLHTEPSNGRFAGNEERIDVSVACFSEFASARELRIRQAIGNVYGQQVFALERATARTPA
jgi:SAM-dependent methyltransferase